MMSDGEAGAPQVRSADHLEGLSAFIEKRKPTFQGR